MGRLSHLRFPNIANPAPWMGWDPRGTPGALHSLIPEHWLRVFQWRPWKRMSSPRGIYTGKGITFPFPVPKKGREGHSQPSALPNIPSPAPWMGWDPAGLHSTIPDFKFHNFQLQVIHPNTCPVTMEEPWGAPPGYPGGSTLEKGSHAHSQFPKSGDRNIPSPQFSQIFPAQPHGWESWNFYPTPQSLNLRDALG